MDPKVGNHPSPASLKRKRGDLGEDDTPDIEHEGLLEKKNKLKSSELSPTNASSDTGDVAEGLIHADGSHTHLPSTLTSSETTGTETNTAATTAAAEAIPPKPTLQTLPRELRDMIYEYVAATEERIVLGRRMVEARHRNSAWSLDQCFDAAVALHPLSMTCQQFRDEFQGEHMSAPNTTWVLLVNNFDLGQLEMFSEYIQSEQYLKVTDSQPTKGFTNVGPGFFSFLGRRHSTSSITFKLSAR